MDVPVAQEWASPENLFEGSDWREWGWIKPESHRVASTGKLKPEADRAASQATLKLKIDKAASSSQPHYF